MKGEKREGVPSEEGRIGEKRQAARESGEEGERRRIPPGGGNDQFLEVLTENMGRA